ncbi:hypothetical protein IKO70_05005 [bacterium]|nr:hypothetical protein [bacterium]
MKKNVLFFVALVLVAAVVATLVFYNETNYSASDTVVPESNLKTVIVGIPKSDSSDLKEITDTFSVDEEKVALRAYWNPGTQGYTAEYIWINPEGKAAYTKVMEMKPEWKRSLVYYRGAKPMAAGNWRLDIRVGGKLYGRTAFTVVRERSKVPLIAQIEAFNSEKITLEEAQLLADRIRCYADKKCSAEEALAAVNADLGNKKTGLAVSVFRNAVVTDMVISSSATISAAMKELTEKIKPDDSAPASVELSVLHSQMELKNPSEHLLNAKKRAGMGFTLSKDGKSAAMLPVFIVRNQIEDGVGVVRQLAVDAGLAEHEWKNAKISVFMTQDFVLSEKMEKAKELAFTRSRVYVEDVTRQDLINAVNNAWGWYLRNQITEGEEAGRYMYTFFPSKDLEPAEDWGLRNLNAIFVLAEIAKDQKDPVKIASVKRAIDTFARFLKEGHGGKWLDWPYQRKVHSIAGTAFLMAAMAELEVPGYEDTMKKMVDAIISLQQPDGKLLTDFTGKYRDVDQNYYPGETLLMLMRYYKKTGYKPALDAVEKAYPFYQAFWNKKENQQGPFVPWQVRAYQEAWSATKDKRYADFVFQLTDWMLKKYKPLGSDAEPGRQGALSTQFAGTGVYSEGISAATRLAREIGDKERYEKYSKALRGMTGYVLGLQFKDEDTYWVKRPDKVRGALSMRPDNEELRIDSTYHAISGVHYTSKLFTDEEWKAIEWK